MKCLILAAGYATRLYPLTENFPKPLLQVQGKTILDWLIEDIDASGAVDEYVVISNHRFARHFEDWAKNKVQKITVLDDGTETNETRLGAVKDIRFAIERLQLDEELLVIAGDNLLDFSLTRFIGYAKKKGTSCIMCFYEEELKKLQKCGNVAKADDGRVLEMVEKPQVPISNWCAVPFYYYTREDARLVEKGIEAGCGTDAPGSYMAWLCQQTPVHAMEMPGRRYDIGNLASYEEVQKNYKGVTV